MLEKSLVDVAKNATAQTPLAEAPEEFKAVYYVDYVKEIQKYE